MLLKFKSLQKIFVNVNNKYELSFTSYTNVKEATFRIHKNILFI